MTKTIHVVEFKMSKGVTVEAGKDRWTKKNLELIVDMPMQHTDEDVQAALTRAEYIIDNFLGHTDAEAETRKTHTPGGFDPEELMKHAWKGKKDPDHEGQYLKGSTSWGWDFKNKFSDEVLAVLEKGPIKIDQYEFTLSQNLVSTKKRK